MQNVEGGFSLCSTPPAGGVISQAHYIKMSSQGIMSSKKASNKPGL